MTPLKRNHVNKGKAAGQFKRATGRTKAANMNQPMRGGWRL